MLWGAQGAIDKYPTKKHDFFVASLVVWSVMCDQALMYWKCWSLWIVSEKVLKSWASWMPTESDLAGRLDLREGIPSPLMERMPKRTWTMQSRIKRKNGNFELGVHIADVPYYVKEPELDKKPSIRQPLSMWLTAMVLLCRRSASTARSIPMWTVWPCRLSWRLMPRSTWWHTITQTIIKTTFRMTYSDVNDIIAGDRGKAEQFKSIVPSIDSMVAWDSGKHAF